MKWETTTDGDDFIRIPDNSYSSTKLFRSEYHERVQAWEESGAPINLAQALVRRGIELSSEYHSNIRMSKSVFNTLTDKAQGEFLLWMEQNKMVFYGGNQTRSQYMITEEEASETEAERERTGMYLFWREKEKNLYYGSDSSAEDATVLWVIRYEEEHTCPYLVKISADVHETHPRPIPLGMEARHRSIPSAKEYAEKWHAALCELYRNYDPERVKPVLSDDG